MQATFSFTQITPQNLMKTVSIQFLNQIHNQRPKCILCGQLHHQDLDVLHLGNKNVEFIFIIIVIVIIFYFLANSYVCVISTTFTWRRSWRKFVKHFLWIIVTISIPYKKFVHFIRLFDLHKIFIWQFCCQLYLFLRNVNEPSVILTI